MVPINGPMATPMLIEASANTKILDRYPTLKFSEEKLVRMPTSMAARLTPSISLKMMVAVKKKVKLFENSRQPYKMEHAVVTKPPIVYKDFMLVKYLDDPKNIDDEKHVMNPMP